MAQRCVRRHAHALIRSIDVTAARARPGVLAVLTGADARADGLKVIPASGGPRRTSRPRTA